MPIGLQPKDLVAGCRVGKHPCGMKPMRWLAVVFVSVVTVNTATAGNAKPEDWAALNDPALEDYFRAETAALAGRCLAEIHTLADWEARRGEYRRQLQEMLGLWP